MVRYKGSGLASSQGLWQRWRKGESISEIGRALGHPPGTIFTALKKTGGISPVQRNSIFGLLFICGGLIGFLVMILYARSGVTKYKEHIEELVTKDTPDRTTKKFPAVAKQTASAENIIAERNTENASSENPSGEGTSKYISVSGPKVLDTEVNILIQLRISKTLEEAIEKAEERHSPRRKNTNAIVRIYANWNAAIAAGASLTPGLWGVLTIVPELILITRNQIQMVYDIGAACGKKAKLHPRVLLAIVVIVLGEGGIGLATIRGNQILVKRASLRAIQKLTSKLGGRVTQRILNRILTRWIPIVGSVVMAAWVRQSTIEMGREAARLFEKELVLTDTELTENEITK